MRAPRLPAVLLLGLLVFGGCKNGGFLGGNSSATGDSGDQKQQPQQQKKQSGQGGTNQTEPQASVSGKPSAASDRGSASAVGHQSVAQPGAPEGTAPDSSQKPAAKPSSPQQ